MVVRGWRLDFETKNRGEWLVCSAVVKVSWSISHPQAAREDVGSDEEREWIAPVLPGHDPLASSHSLRDRPLTAGVGQIIGLHLAPLMGRRDDQAEVFQPLQAINHGRTGQPGAPHELVEADRQAAV